MANLFSGITDFLSGGELDDALSRLNRSGDVISKVPVPDLLSMLPQLQYQVQQGTMTPAQAQAAFAQVTGNMNPAEMKYATAVMQGSMSPAQAFASMQSDSGMNTVQSDQGSLQGQREALADLAEIGDNKGLTEADRAQFAATMNQANSEAARNRAAQVQQLQMQGNAGTGAELAARLSGAQGSANAGFAAGADVAKAAQARALQAIQSGLQGNANLNTQMFDQAAQKAKAQDAVNQFNTQARNTIGLQNAQMSQQANQQNFQTANQVALANQQAQQAAYQQNSAYQQAANLANYNTQNQFALQNAQNQQAANLANAGYGQQANAANFAMANQIAGANTGIYNQQAQFPYNAAQANFTNQLNQATNAGNADWRAGQTLADLASKQADRTQAGLNGLAKELPWGDIIKGVGGAASTIGGAVGDAASGVGDWLGDAWDTVSDWFSDEDLKTGKRQLSDKEIDKIMGHMTAYKYRYKGPSTNPDQVGVMAQDMEKGMPSSVVDTPAGKLVQKPEALNQALAVLANQHERIKKLEGKK